jgi:non-ribosomal peptide synthetase component F
MNILSSEQYKKIVFEFNQTEKPYPRDKTIHKLFEEQVLKTPDNIAVIYEDRKLTYQELNNKANQLANYLLKHYEIKPDDLIALLLNRSECIIIAILAVLKTGAAYVPISPDYPEERIKYILEDIRAKIAINDCCFKKSFFLN